MVLYCNKLWGKCSEKINCAPKISYDILLKNNHRKVQFVLLEQLNLSVLYYMISDAQGCCNNSTLRASKFDKKNSIVHISSFEAYQSFSL
uniref:Uncharacterized protein n=1 Tax=Triticum urartu TaxID=4572 RepID=A0A8R7UUW4_TRIUA